MTGDGVKFKNNKEVIQTLCGELEKYVRKSSNDEDDRELMCLKIAAQFIIYSHEKLEDGTCIVDRDDLIEKMAFIASIILDAKVV
jgi:hypothetical protein